MKTMVEEFLEGLLEEAKNRTPEEKKRSRELANKFVYSRLSYNQRERWKLTTLSKN